jgi:hypothetical protein
LQTEFALEHHSYAVTNRTARALLGAAAADAATAAVATAAAAAAAERAKRAPTLPAGDAAAAAAAAAAAGVATSAAGDAKKAPELPATPLPATTPLLEAAPPRLEHATAPRRAERPPKAAATAAATAATAAAAAAAAVAAAAAADADDAATTQPLARAPAAALPLPPPSMRGWLAAVAGLYAAVGLCSIRRKRRERGIARAAAERACRLRLLPGLTVELVS